MSREFRYSTQTYQNLRKNRAHQFAANHALNLYKLNTIYTFIPKNACSTMRLSLAIANGCVSDTKDFNWIHKNNDTFRADLKSLICADYSFVILRCPYARLASVYLDKIVGRTQEAWHFYDLVDRTIDLNTLTFTEFVKQLAKPTVRNENIHWKPQVDFLVYKEYDDYFCLEEFANLDEVLRAKIGFEIVDARPLTQHGIDRLEIIEEEDFSSISPVDIYNLKISGKCPSPRSLYCDETISLVSSCFQTDIQLYQDIFGSKNLMYS
ncbi:MAG: sulfotransferase family 2 domain-containing protein [Geitlerinemataceae cyanobacterium]